MAVLRHAHVKTNPSRVETLTLGKPQKKFRSTSGPTTKKGGGGESDHKGKRTFFESLKTKKRVPMTTKLEGLSCRTTIVEELFLRLPLGTC